MDRINLKLEKTSATPGVPYLIRSSEELMKSLQKVNNNSSTSSLNQKRKVKNKKWIFNSKENNVNP